MTARYFSGNTLRRPDQVREGDVWTSKGLQFEGGRWVPYRRRSNALDNDWTAGEDEKLKAYFAAVYAGGDKRTLKEFAAELGRSEGACHTRAGKKLGILQQREIKGGFCTTPKWTDDEHAILDEWYPKVPIGEVMKRLPGRSKSSVFARANSRGLVSPYAQKYREWTKAEQRAVRIAYKRGIAIADLAFAVGRNPVTASKYATNHGLDFGRRPLLAQSPTLELILSLEDDNVPIPQLLNQAAIRPARLARRRPVETSDKELRRRERETLAARRKQRRADRAEERRRQRREAAECEKAQRAAKHRLVKMAAQREREKARAQAAMERARDRETARAHAGMARARDRAAMDRANAVRANAVRRRQMQAAEAFVDSGQAMSRATPIYIKIAQRAVLASRAEAARLADPVEQAKLTLQRRGRVVHSMAVWGGRKDLFFVTGLGKDVTPEQLLDAAARLAA